MRHPQRLGSRELASQPTQGAWSGVVGSGPFADLAHKCEQMHWLKSNMSSRVPWRSFPCALSSPCPPGPSASPSSSSHPGPWGSPGGTPCGPAAPGLVGVSAHRYHIPECGQGARLSEGHGTRPGQRAGDPGPACQRGLPCVVGSTQPGNTDCAPGFHQSDSTNSIVGGPEDKLHPHPPPDASPTSDLPKAAPTTWSSSGRSSAPRPGPAARVGRSGLQGAGTEH